VSVTTERTATDPVVAAWRDLTACHAAACAALERELSHRHGLGLSEFEVLERLAEEPHRMRRAQDLADLVHLSQSALSRLVDRLAKQGLGERRHAEAVPAHREVLTRVLGAKTAM
jgi:DNA-binding MarR family transcriptional regulator